jgi:hypothetical protein
VRGPALALAALGLTATAVGLAVVLARGSPSDQATADPLLVDELAGRYRAVAFGATRAEIVSALGSAPKWTTYDPVGPLGAKWHEIGGPNVIESAGPADAVRYRDASFLLGSRRLYTIVVVAADAQTRRGVGIGDDLELVRERYGRAVCGVFKPEGTPWPYCAVRVAAKRYVWFGQEPIRSITVSRLPLGDTD